MVTAALTYYQVDRLLHGVWRLKYIALSLYANVLIASFISITRLPEKRVEIPVLKVNLMALAASVPARVKQAPPPVSTEKVVVETHAMEKVAANEIQPAPPEIDSNNKAVRQNQKEVMRTESLSSNPSHDQGNQMFTVIHKANYRRQIPVVYPGRALELGQEGVVVLHVRVNRNGLTDELKIAGSSGYRMLDMAALAAVRKWEFEPTSANGNAIASWVHVPVRFVIQ